MKRFFFVGFALVALVCAGVLSYLADSDPDGLDSATLSGCEEVNGQLTGDCIARNAGEHGMADSPLADYAVGGDDRFTGVAGVLGVLATAAVAGGLFWLLRRRPAGPRQATRTGTAGGTGTGTAAGTDAAGITTGDGTGDGTGIGTGDSGTSGGTSGP